MAFDFHSARHWARELVEQAVGAGGVVVDATMGNGHDTLWLCELVGDSGRVYAFDIQKAAVEATRARLTEAGLAGRAFLLHAGHERVLELVDEPIDAALFNLGWLPGADHALTTRVPTTMRAVEGCLTRLKEGGLLTICAYPGHEEGERELQTLLNWGAALDNRRYDVMLRRFLNQPQNPPVLLAVKKNRIRPQ